MPVFIDSAMFKLPALVAALLFVIIPSETLNVTSSNKYLLLIKATSRSQISSTTTPDLENTQNVRITKQATELNTALINAPGKQAQTSFHSYFVPMPTNGTTVLISWKTVKLNLPVVTRGIWLTGKSYLPHLFTHSIGVTKKIKTP